MKGDPREHAVNYAMLRSMQRAVYSPEDEGHYALASDCYCHFTSPIRRYPDLTVHRLIDDAQPRQEAGAADGRAARSLGDHCSEREQRAAEAERELKKVKLLNYLADKIGMELDGVITGVENFGLFVTGIGAAGRGLHPHQRPDRRLLPLRPRRPRDRRPSQRQLVSPGRHGPRGGGGVDVDTRSLDFRLVARITGGKRIGVKMPAKARSASKTSKEDLRRGKKKAGRPGKSKPGGLKHRKARPGGKTKRKR